MHSHIDITVQVKWRICWQCGDPTLQIRAGKIGQVARMEFHPLANNLDDFVNR